MGEWSGVHIFFTSALIGGEWSALCPCCFTPGQRAPHPPSTHWIGGQVDPRASLDDTEKLNSLLYQDSKSDPSVIWLVGSWYTIYTTAALNMRPLKKQT
jgi:hypothetical protein